MQEAKVWMLTWLAGKARVASESRKHSESRKQSFTEISTTRLEGASERWASFPVGAEGGSGAGTRAETLKSTCCGGARIRRVEDILGVLNHIAYTNHATELHKLIS